MKYSEPEMRLVISEGQIERRIQVLAKEISKEYKGRDIILVGVLNGVFMFFADLVKAMSIPVRVDFIRLASYTHSESSGQIQMTKDVETDLSGAHVLIIEDIVDTGLTLSWLKKHMQDLGASTVKACVMVNKLERRNITVDLDYVGFNVDKGFLVGYGLDYDGRYRDLSEIYDLFIA